MLNYIKHAKRLKHITFPGVLCPIYALNRLHDISHRKGKARNIRKTIDEYLQYDMLIYRNENKRLI